MADNSGQKTVTFGQRGVAANCFGQLRFAGRRISWRFQLHLNCKCPTHNSKALIIINQTIHSPIGHGSQLRTKHRAPTKGDGEWKWKWLGKLR